MKSFKSRQDWKTPKIDIAPIRIRYCVTGASSYETFPFSTTIYLINSICYFGIQYGIAQLNLKTIIHFCHCVMQFDIPFGKITFGKIVFGSFVENFEFKVNDVLRLEYIVTTIFNDKVNNVVYHFCPNGPNHRKDTKSKA